ncbi:hypothetical protein E3N88_28413 [Mikania micrantha]|uniref:Uncharacterized protein n=1 Tax=Mikania micrantha TaxID=192012 RepID=A0A5N6N2E1_9ASTR|nr:hypothetical protein E3N88_28413 [Mikania micrantha]
MILTSSSTTFVKITQAENSYEVRDGCDLVASGAPPVAYETSHVVLVLGETYRITFLMYFDYCEPQRRLLQDEEVSLEMQEEIQKEEIRKDNEAIKVKAAIEKAAARKIAKESMELIEDECLQLLELAASYKGLS